MADKSISELYPATVVNDADLFVMEQTGVAKKLTGAYLASWLASLADGHGGIVSIDKTSTSGLVDTYTITYASVHYEPGPNDLPIEVHDTTTFTVTNGKAISSVTDYWAVSDSNSVVPQSWNTTMQTMTASNRYLWHYQTITYNDASTADTTKTVVGVYGDTGQAWYVWIRYSSHEPTQDSDMGTVPDEWMGVYSGTSSTAPTTYTSYTWYEIKGDIGNPSTLESAVVSYQSGATGTVPPSGEWSADPPIVMGGNYLWTRTIFTFNTGDPVTIYSVARQGVDGTGAPGEIVPLINVAGGEVGESESFAREDHQHPLTTLHLQATVTTLPTTISNEYITSDMRVVNCVISTPNAVTSDLSWSTSAGTLALSGALKSGSSTVIDFDLDTF